MRFLFERATSVGNNLLLDFFIIPFQNDETQVGPLEWLLQKEREENKNLKDLKF